MSNLYNQFFFQPLFNALIFIYSYFSFESLGLAVILLTIFIRILLFPFFHKSTKNQIIIQKIQPKIKEIMDKHKDNKEEQVKKVMEIYKEHQVNPFSGFLLLFIQLPILIALYQVFYYGLAPESFHYVYSFIRKPETINFIFLGLINLKEKSILMVVLAAILQYFQGKLLLPKNSQNNKKDLSSAEIMSRQMVFFGPILTILVLSNLPAVLGLYWSVSSAFSIFQQIIINKSLKKLD